MTSIQLINVIIHIKALQSPLNHVNVKLSAYIDPRKEINDRDTKFKIGHIVRISKYKSIFVKDSLLFQIGLENFFVIKKLKSNVPWTCFISDLKDEEIGGTFTKQNRKK